MTKTLAALLAAATFTVACSSSSETDGAPKQGQGAQNAAERGTAAAEELTPTCGAWFDALLARDERCGAGVLRLDSGPWDKDAAVATCIARSAAPGTGYTKAFYEGCKAAAETLACDAHNALVKACEAPRGSLARGMACAKDDQCADGYCQLPENAKEGTTCGTCAVPIWGERGDRCWDLDTNAVIRNFKCRPGLYCETAGSGGSGQCKSAIPASDSGDSCNTGTGIYDPCERGFSCEFGKCVRQPIVPEGGSLRAGEVYGICAPGTYEDQPTKTCLRRGAIGEKCDTYEKPCSAWLTCNVDVCELPETLSCN